jgi:hypothetical protein
VGGVVAWERRSGAAAALGEAIGGGDGAPGAVWGRRQGGGSGGGSGRETKRERELSPRGLSATLINQ